MAERQLKHMPADGGVPVTFHWRKGRVEGAAWGPGDTVAFVEDRSLWLIDTSGGQPELITDGNVLALTPDGRVLFFVGERNGARAIYRRPMDGLAAEAIPGTEGADFVFVSPDGLRLGFVAERQLKHMPADGGVPVTFHEGRVEGAAWGPGDTVAFVEDRSLWLIDTSGGQPELITDGNVYRGPPSFLPGGREVLAFDW